MTNEEINKRIAELRGLPDCKKVYYSSKIEWAFDLFEDGKKTIFTQRRSFFDVLASILKNQIEIAPNKVAWPDALIFLTPRAICLAWIKWKEGAK